MSWLLAFLGFAALIVFHELGHFVAAKAVGMRVERFALFFPPLIWRRQRGETEYAIGAVPLGGYVRITGMNPDEELSEELKARSYAHSPVWKRVVVIFAGPAVNLLIAFIVLCGIFLVDGRGFITPTLESVAPSSASAGVLEPGDRIISIDGVPGFSAKASAEELSERAAKVREAIGADRRCGGGRVVNGCTATTAALIVYEREGTQATTKLKPRFNAELDRFLLGFSFGREAERVGPIHAATLTFEGMWNVTRLTVEAIVKVFYDPEARDQVSGVVGSYETARQSIEFDAIQALTVLALISLSLAVINLFPFLPLDGGHIFWALAEKVSGRKIPLAVMERASIIGIMLVAFLFIVGLSNDLGRITSGEGFGVR